MKNFNNFKQAYEAMENARNNILGIQQSCITDAGWNTFSKLRSSAIVQIDVARERLRVWLKKNFPKDVPAAARWDQFEFSEFFAFLKKHPELVKDNREPLEDLLKSMKKTGMNSDEIPSIRDFPKS